MLTDDALTYYANQSEYTDLKHSGKRINLNGVAVKTPMHCPPGGKEKPHFKVISLSGDQWKFQTKDMAEAAAWQTAIQARIEACIAQNLSRGALEMHTCHLSELNIWFRGHHTEIG